MHRIARRSRAASCGGQTSGIMSGFVAALAVVLMIWATCTEGFNFDSRAPVVFDGPSGSMFGFSVAQHRSGTTDWVLVGAPEAVTLQPNVDKGGAVYKCPVTPLDNSRGPCEQVPFDTTGDTSTTYKSNQWFGATVESAGADGSILACAPRLVWFSEPSLSNKAREPTGTCYVGSSDFSAFKEYSPCQDKSKTGFEKISHCMAGFSGKITEDNQVLVFGAPGSYFLQGQVYSINLDGTKNQSTTEDSAKYDNSYKGFSMALGDFNGDGVDDYVVGIPRGEDLYGKVEILDQTLTEITKQKGDQIVSYFGNSVEAVDVNGDGRDDLIVGAPMYTDRRTAIEKWEAGQVYVYLQQADNSLADPLLLTGPKIRARFGYSLSAIGDANQDGYNDIAIGAPYDSLDDSDPGTGLVYIYHGSDYGLKTEPSQILSPSSLGLSGISTFGFSLQGGRDMDSNSYPDLVVGAESSDRAILVRTRPVVQLNGELTVQPSGIDLDDKDVVVDGTSYTGFVVTVCFNYEGTNIPANIDILYTATLDSRISSSPRALFKDNKMNFFSTSRNLAKGMEFCADLEAFVVNTIQDKLTPISVTVEYDLNQDETNLQPYDILPIKNNDADSSKTSQVYIQNNCENNICVPDLDVQVSTKPSVITVGGSEDLTLQVTLMNNGDEAFQSMLEVHYPQGLEYIRLERSEQMDLSVTCTEDIDNRVITCDTGNPLAARYKLNFGLTLSTSKVSGERENIEFYFEASSENAENENTIANNKLNVTVSAAVQTDLKLLSASDPESLTYISSEPATLFPSNASESDIGPAIMHLYEVRNAGPSTAGQIDMTIRWPQKDDNGDYVFYLLGLSLAEGISCEITSGKINPENVRLDSSTKSQLSDVSTSRKRREAVPAAEAQPQTDPIYCSGQSCVEIQCTVDQLLATESKVVKLLGRFWQRTFITDDPLAKLLHTIASSAEATVINVPYNIPLTETYSASTTASTTVSAEELVTSSGGIAWWVIVVSVLGGILLLFVIIVILYKCGFFERKKLEEEQKLHQPYQPVPEKDIDQDCSDGFSNDPEV